MSSRGVSGALVCCGFIDEVGKIVDEVGRHVIHL